MTLATTIAVNMQAMECFQMGRDEQALALYRTHIESDEHWNRSALGSNDRPPPGEAHASNAKDDAALWVWSVSLEEFMDTEPPPSNEVFVPFHRPFDCRMEPSSTVEMDHTEATAALLPSVVWYNMGLACHRRAILSAPTDGVALYREALEYYTLSDQLFSSNLPVACDEFCALKLAVLNNICHCWSMLHQSESAWLHWHRMETTFATTESLSESERLFFAARIALGRHKRTEQ